MMKNFNIFKSKKTQSASTSFSLEEINCWPSIPNDDMQVPVLDELVKKSTYSNEAAKILEWAELAKKDGDEVEYQVVMKSQFGSLTLPVLVKRPDGGFLVYYSHCSEWNDDGIVKLLDWTVKLRSCDFVHSLKIEICSSPENLPLKVQEIISKRTEHRMFLSMIPHLNHDDPNIRARVFAEGFGHFYNENKILNYDEASLRLVESWFRKVVESISRDSFYYQIALNLLASFFGRVLKETFGGVWGEGVFPELSIGDDIKVRVHPYKIMADFLIKPKLENSPVQNMHLVAQEIKERR